MTDKASVKDEIVGTWKLISWTYKNVNGIVSDFFGPAPIGILMYDANGYMNAQLMKSAGRPLFEGKTLMSGNDGQIVNAYHSYAAYFGKYEEKEPGVLIHKVEGSLQPNWVGHEEVRYAHIKDNRLTLKAPTVVINDNQMDFSVLWERIP